MNYNPEILYMLSAEASEKTAGKVASLKKKSLKKLLRVAETKGSKGMTRYVDADDVLEAYGTGGKKGDFLANERKGKKLKRTLGGKYHKSKIKGAFSAAFAGDKAIAASVENETRLRNLRKSLKRLSKEKTTKKGERKDLKKVIKRVRKAEKYEKGARRAGKILKLTAGGAGAAGLVGASGAVGYSAGSSA